MQYKASITILTSLILCLQAWAAAKLPKETCITTVKELETMSNVNPKDVEVNAPLTLDKLRDGESLTYYFIAYNIYVENLFNKGKVEKASRELDAMVNEALNQNDPECQTIALRAQGQFYYKLGLYERAAESLRKAMEVCPRYDSDQLCSYFTWSSTLFGLVQSDIKTGRLDEAERWLAEMDKMMQWLDKIGKVDSVGYKPVMILGLKAKIAINRGDIETARHLLAQCPEYIKPDVPSRAYVEYYVGKMMLAVKEGRHADAIPLLDELIDIHISDYKPIAAKFLYQKANSLYELGRYQESAETYRQYEELKSEVYEISIAHQLDELRMRYDVEKMQHEHDLMRTNLIIAIIICIALTIIIAIEIINQKKLKKKNKVLAQNIRNMHQLAKQKEEDNDRLVQETDAEPNPEYITIGNTIVDYIKTSKCYLSANCGRETIKDALGVSEQILSKSVPLVTGMTFVNYINRLRLDYAIDLLENHPEVNINKISTMCGFGTLRQFQRVFKQHYELTPSAYREAVNSDPSEN